MENFDQKVCDILGRSGARVTVLDLGASGDSRGYGPFQKLRGNARFILVDPDSRDFESSGRDDEIRVPKAVVEDEGKDEVEVFLTQYPHCSSTLKPNAGKVANFVYADFFRVVDSVAVPATTINAIARDNEVTAIDWIKLDTQGTELRIIKSLDEKLLAKLLCIDVEISLYDHYQGADRLPALHEYLVDNGFWIADFSYQSQVRMRRLDLDKLEGRNARANRRMVESLDRVPTACEIRYVRQLNAEVPGFEFPECLKLWAICFLNGHYAQAFTLSEVIGASFDNELTEEMREVSRRAILSNRRIRTASLKRFCYKVINRIFPDHS